MLLPSTPCPSALTDPGEAQPGAITNLSGGPPAFGLDIRLLQALAARPPAPTISLYLPVHHPGAEQRQDLIRLKNLIHQARPLLIDEVGAQLSDHLLGRILAVCHDPEFLAHADGAVAFFASEQDLVYFRLPLAVAEQVIVNGHCHLKPLLPLLAGDGRFYVLELTQQGVHLHAGTRFGLHQIELAAPGMLDGEDDRQPPERSTGVRTAGRGATRYFSTSDQYDAKDRIRAYFRRIDACVCSLLHAERAPLVTAGVEYLLPLYWEVNSYPHLIQAGITGATAELSPRTLHDRAWTIVAPHFAKAADEAYARYIQLRGTVRASESLADILRAAHQGRIEDLFAASDSERWGTYGANQDMLREHLPRAQGDEELLNTAVIHGLATRANVQVLPRALMPNRAEVAAVFRY